MLVVTDMVGQVVGKVNSGDEIRQHHGRREEGSVFVSIVFVGREAEG